MLNTLYMVVIIVKVLYMLQKQTNGGGSYCLMGTVLFGDDGKVLAMDSSAGWTKMYLMTLNRMLKNG